jgi:hypothetical protein
VRRAGGTRSAFDRGDVDMGRQILAADMNIRVVMDAMAEVGAKRAIATPQRVVELGRG